MQDVWIIHERTRRGRAGVPEGEYGTTIRVYEPRAGTWNVTWNGPVQGVVRTFVARRSGDEIVQDGRDEDGRPLRWIFSEITPDSFRLGKRPFERRRGDVAAAGRDARSAQDVDLSSSASAATAGGNGQAPRPVPAPVEP